MRILVAIARLLPVLNIHRSVIYGDAASLNTNVVCPSSLIKASPSERANPVACTFYIKEWTFLDWGLETLKRTEDKHDCLKSNKCVGNNQSHQLIFMGNKTSVLYTAPLTPKQEGKWTCVIYSYTKIDGYNSAFVPVGNQTCKIKIYEPPDNLRCEKQLHPDDVFVSCKTEKIYPRGLCKIWISRKYQAAELQNEKTTNSSSKASKSDPNYFQSTCRQNLTSLIRAITEDVSIIMKFRMYPDTEGHDLSSTEGAFSEVTEEIEIALPDNEEIENSTLTLSTDENVTMHCKVGGGHPAVISTTVACRFQVDEPDTKQSTSLGNSSTAIRFFTSGDTSGDTCSCWGDHITGKTETTTVTFFVGYDGYRNYEPSTTILNNETLMIIAGAGVATVFMAGIALKTVYCCVKGRRTSTGKDFQSETDTDINAADGFPEYAKVNAKKKGEIKGNRTLKDNANDGPHVMIDNDTVFYTNDVYQSHGVVEEYLKNRDRTTSACSNRDENEEDELLYANVSSVSNRTSVTGADGKTAPSDVNNKSAAKRSRRANDLVYVEVEIVKPTVGPDRKDKVKSEQHKVDYVSIDFQKKASLNEEIDG